MTIRDDVNRLEVKLDKLLDQTSDTKILLFKHDHDIYGDGKEKRGFCGRLDTVEKTINQHSKYFWLISLLCSGAGFVISKLWK